MFLQRTITSVNAKEEKLKARRRLVERAAAPPDQKVSHIIPPSYCSILLLSFYLLFFFLRFLIIEHVLVTRTLMLPDCVILTSERVVSIEVYGDEAAVSAVPSTGVSSAARGSFDGATNNVTMSDRVNGLTEENALPTTYATSY
ncbi:hypothetical protein P5V15_006754 [Pogonomyrmex californicus]